MTVLYYSALLDYNNSSPSNSLTLPVTNKFNVHTKAVKRSPHKYRLTQRHTCSQKLEESLCETSIPVTPFLSQL